MGASLWGKDKENPTLQAAVKEINRLLDEAQDFVYKAEAIADEHGLEFSMNLGGYGMGGRYDGTPEGKLDEWGDESDGWHASSQSC